MIYYTTTGYYNHDTLMNSLSKGRDDYFECLKKMGLKRIDVPVLRPHRFLSYSERIKLEMRVTTAWQRKLRTIGSGDILVIHTPSSEKFFSYAPLIERVRARGCRVVTIVFELETFFEMDYRRLGGIKRSASVLTERKLFDLSDAIVVHNDVMKKKLQGIGVDGSKMFSVGVMDYLRDEELSSEAVGRISRDKPVAFAGNLSYEKSQFEYNLPEGFRCNLYGADYTGPTNEHICYKGVYDPMSLMDEMEGSFGLVWDGNSVDGCTGSYGNYLTFNNPHKIALYIASGMPVIVWSGAAMAHFVRKEKCGIIVDSLREVPALVESLSEVEYEEMRMNACRIGNDMRKGVHIRSAVERAIKKVGAELPESYERVPKNNALIVFTREPEAGKTKTRLMKKYTAEQCAKLHECFIEDIARESAVSDADTFIAYTGDKQDVLKRLFGEAFENGRSFEQTGDGLGVRMENAIKYVLEKGHEKVVLIGTDIPELERDTIDDAFEKLDNNDVVIGGTSDGGYYLIGMKEDRHEAFESGHYGGSSVFEETFSSLHDAGLKVGMVKTYSDIDEPEDIYNLRSRLIGVKPGKSDATRSYLADIASISVIVPVYNESGIIDDMIRQLLTHKDDVEIIFVDGGSTDDTVKKILNSGFAVVHSSKGRGIQMNKGALASSGDILFFLHCDSRLPEDFIREIKECMLDHLYGCFGVRFPSYNIFMFTNSIISNCRAVAGAVPFGDQGIFIDRNLFFETGMFPEIPVMEDYEFSLRLKEKGYKPGITKKRIVSSARRYGSGTRNILATEYRMWNLRRLYRNGTNPEEIAIKYKDIR